MEQKKRTRFILRALSVVSGCAGLATIIPYAGANEASILGYKALCPFAPISTVIALYLCVTIHGVLLRATRQAN